MKEKQVTPYKKSKFFLDKKMSMAVYIVVAVIAVICRISQLSTNMNFITGKYIDGNPMKNLTLGVIVIGAVLIGAVLILGESRDKAVKSCILLNPMRLKLDRLVKKISPIAAVGFFSTAALMAFDVAAPLTMLASENMAISTEENPVFIFEGLGGLNLAMYIIMIVCIITFIITGVNVIKGEGITGGNCFFLTSYPIYKLLHIFYLIGEYQLIGPYSERVYMMLADMTSAVFMLLLIRFFAGFEKKHTRFLLIFMAYFSSIICAVSTIPRFVMFFMLEYKERGNMLTPELTEIGMIILPVMVISVFWSAYVYRVMPKLNLTGMRRWKNLQVGNNNGKAEMKDINS
ncbi:MAG: hypothetical protein IJZ72_01140 [Oscillospiraceae bacterium]|nr:hypothetical protein [Oscillospiraceae bacterium]